VPPGTALTAPAFEVTAIRAGNLWLDEHRLAIVDEQGRFAVVDVRPRTVVPVPVDWINGKGSAALFSGRSKTALLDGEHFAQLGGSDHPTRQLITNFATRPWRP